jgi:uncharacterized BrkB/YihY/UPF0761 family membrane protein
METRNRRLLPRLLFWGSVFLLFIVIFHAKVLRSLAYYQPPPPASVEIDGVFIMRTIVTLAVMFAALWVIVSKRYPPADRWWAFGAIGAILAFWFAGWLLTPLTTLCGAPGDVHRCGDS